MATQEVIVDHPQLPQSPIDTSVVIPDHVKRAAALAESYYNQPTEQVPTAPEPTAEAAPVEQPAAEVPVVQAPPLQPAAPQADYVAPASKEDIQDSEWAARYNSMRGRWEASQRTIGSMQEQLSQLGDELMRTQQLLRGQQPQESQQQSHPNNAKLITAEDEQAYGPELIDLARRAALETMGPEIESLRAQNDTLKKRVTDTAQGELRNKLTALVPNWRTINATPEFKSWLRLPNVYTREVRQSMLNRAYAAADVPAVVEFFKDFLREGIATGQMAPAPQQEQPQAPRAAAVPLETLSAPGRARPASGEFSNMPADKPIFTRAQVKTFYDNVRRGAYNGRETEKASLEQSIFAAQSDGRVR